MRPAAAKVPAGWPQYRIRIIGCRGSGRTCDAFSQGMPGSRCPVIQLGFCKLLRRQAARQPGFLHLFYGSGRRPTLYRRFPLENVRYARGSLSRAQAQIRPARAAGLLFAVNHIRDEIGTVTQIELGGAVGETELGRQIGRRALLWGGI